MDKVRRLNGKQSIFYSPQPPFITFPYIDSELGTQFKKVPFTEVFSLLLEGTQEAVPLHYMLYIE